MCTCVVMWTRGIRVCCHRMFACEGWWGVRHQSHTNCQLMMENGGPASIQMHAPEYICELLSRQSGHATAFQLLFCPVATRTTSLSQEFGTGSSASTVRKMCSMSNNICVSVRVKWGYHGSLHIVVCAFIYVESRTPLKSLSAKF